MKRIFHPDFQNTEILFRRYRYSIDTAIIGVYSKRFARVPLIWIRGGWKG